MRVVSTQLARDETSILMRVERMRDKSLFESCFNHFARHETNIEALIDKSLCESS